MKAALVVAAAVVLGLPTGLARAQAVDTDSTRRAPLASAAIAGVTVAPVAALAFLATPPLPGEKMAGRDKVLHGAIAFSATSVLVDVGLKPAAAGIVVCLAAGGWEVAQGEISRYDIAAGCGSALVAAMWRAAWEARGSRR